MSILRTRVSAFVAAVVASVGLIAPAVADEASAMTPAQTTLSGTVNTLYWDLDAFWRWALNNPRYVSPTIGYYNGPTYKAACGGQLDNYTIMAYCEYAARPEIWIAANVNQDKINRLGDYSAGFFLAHEWGHHVAKTLGLTFRSIKGRELYADCIAGVFTKYAHAQSRRLDDRDYWEGVWSIDDYYPAEGGANGYPLKADRKAWYQWGFTSYSITNCAQATTV